MTDNSLIPNLSKLETNNLPIEWLHNLALKEGNSKKPIYKIHKWWARRLGSLFRALILLSISPKDQTNEAFQEAFYSKHDLSNLRIFDPFMGGGTTVIESSKLNASVIGIDIDPIAWFVTTKEVEPFPFDEINSAINVIKTNVGMRITSYYTTKVNNNYYSVIYFFWVDEIICSNCQCAFEGHPHYILAKNKKNRQKTIFCKTCHEIYTVSEDIQEFQCLQCMSITNIDIGTVKGGKYICPNCGDKKSILSIIKSGKPLDKKLFAIEYEEEVSKGIFQRKYKRVDGYDLLNFQKAQIEFNSLKEKLIFPKNQIPTKGRNDIRPINHGYQYYYQLFNPRQLLSLSLIWAEILSIKKENVREFLILAFSDSLASNNMLCRYAFGYQKLTPLFGLHAYAIVSRSVENNVWGANLGRGSFTKCVNKLIKGKEYAEKPYEFMYEGHHLKKVYTDEKISRPLAQNFEEWEKTDAKCLLLRQSSKNIDVIKDDSIDLIITDPPYFDNISYSELSDFYYAWLQDILINKNSGTHQVTPLQEALYVNGNGNVSQSIERFEKDLTYIFQNGNKKLKSNGMLIFTYHHRKMEAWLSLCLALWNSNFKISNVFPVRSEGNSGFHSTEGTIKWDCVIVCRKKNQKLEVNNYPIDIIKNEIIENRNYWYKRFFTSKLSFEWADLLSLSYGVALKEITNSFSTETDIRCAFKEIKTFLYSFLTEKENKLMRND